MMEPLQEAIERARLQREGVIGRTSAPGQIKPQHGPIGHPVSEAAPAAPEPARVVEPTPVTEQAPVAQQAPVAPASPARSGADILPRAPDVHYSATRRIELTEKSLMHNRVIAGQLLDPRVEAYRQLRSQVLAKMKRHSWRSLAITSAHENAGKTLTAINLAISISQEANQTVLLVDLDLRKPNVHTTLGIDISRGIVDHLIREEPIENILLNPGYPRLVVLPGLPQGHYSSEILSSARMKAFMKDVIDRYPDRIIIFDLPPLLRNDDAMVFVPNVDACLFVVEDGVTTTEDIERSRQLLNDTPLLGTVLNKAR